VSDVSCSGRFTPGGRTPGTHWIGGWLGPRAGLDTVVARRKIPIPWRESNPGRPARSLVTISTQRSLTTSHKEVNVRWTCCVGSLTIGPNTVIERLMQLGANTRANKQVNEVITAQCLSLYVKLHNFSLKLIIIQVAKLISARFAQVRSQNLCVLH
jgi:hypothetical protein